MDKYDIVYSVIAHENPDNLNKMIQNIAKYNKNNNFLICLHLNKLLYSNFKSKYKFVIINPNNYDKKKGTHDIMKAHIENFMFVNDNCKIIFNSFMPLSSYCLFIKQMKKINPNNDLLLGNHKTYCEEKKTTWHWPNFFQNNKIIELLNKKKISLVGQQTSGTLYSYDTFSKITKFVTKHDIFFLIAQKTYFDEILFPSLEKHIIGFVSERCCKIFWQGEKVDSAISTIRELLAGKNNCYCVKSKNTEIIKFIDNLNE